MVLNITKNKKIGEKARICSGFLCKTIGLMFSTKPRTIIFSFDFEQRQYLHMFFVFFPIDLIFLDSDKQVVELKENFRPFTFYNSKKEAQYVIECPAGKIKETKTSVGDKVKF